MSTIRVNAIQSTSTTDGGISIDTSGHVTLDGQNLPSAGPLSNRNLVINGAMQVAQRGTSSTDSSYGTVDRFPCYFTGGAQTQTQETLSSGTPYGEGFRYFLRVANTTSSTGASHNRHLMTKIEAQDIAQSGWEYTSSSSYITFSFWVRASVEQEYYGYLQARDGTQQIYPFSLGTLTANTWTKITKTAPGNSNITVNNDNGEGLRLVVAPFWGTDYTDSGVSVDTWAAYASGTRTPDYTNTWASTTGATFDITGVQLEVGEVATPFEHRSYGDELAKCQRYYYKTQPGQYASFAMGYNRNTTLTHAYTTFPVPMRTAPTSIETSGTAGDYSINYLASNATCSVVPSFDQGSAEGADFNFTVSSGLTAGQGAKAIAQTASGYLAWSAEL
jgi:hypothetical protein